MSYNPVSRFYLFDGQAMKSAWYGAQDQIDVESVTVPFLQHELILNLGEHFSVNQPSKNTLLFTEIQTSAITTRARGKYEALGIMFSPVGIYETFGLSLADFRALCTSDPSEIAGAELVQKLCRQRTPEEKLSVFINHITGKSRKKPVPSVVLKITNRASAAITGPVEINKLAADLSFTSKHLIASFKDVVGLTPKQYLLLCQVNRAAQQMVSHPDQRLTQIALLSGFYDQSHFIRAFRKFTGMTPFTFRAKRRDQPHSFPNTFIC